MKIKSKLLLLVCLLTSIFGIVSVSFANEKEFIPDPEISAQIASNPQIIIQKLKASINKLLENPATLTLDIEYDSVERLSQGWIKRAYIHTSRGKAENLFLHKADIEFLDVQVDTTRLFKEEKIDPVKMSNINMDVVIKEVDLNSFLAEKSKSIRVNKPNIKLKKNSMELSGKTRYGLVRVDFWATGRFEIDKTGQNINFYARKMKVNRMTMPRSFVGMIIRQINPVLSLSKFPFKLNLSEIRMEPGQITFSSFRKGQQLGKDSDKSP